MALPFSDEQSAARGRNRYECQICMEIFCTFSLDVLAPEELLPSQEGPSTSSKPVGEVVFSENEDILISENVDSALKARRFPLHERAKLKSPSSPAAVTFHEPSHPTMLSAATPAGLKDNMIHPMAPPREPRRFMSPPFMFVFQSTSPSLPLLPQVVPMPECSLLRPQAQAHPSRGSEYTPSPGQQHPLGFTLRPSTQTLDSTSKNSSASSTTPRPNSVGQERNQRLMTHGQRLQELSIQEKTEGEKSRDNDGVGRTYRATTADSTSSLESLGTTGGSGSSNPYSSSTASSSASSPVASSSIPSLDSPSIFTGNENQDIKLGYAFDCNPSHAYCLECLANYLKDALATKRWPVHCPGYQCKSTIGHSVVEVVLGPAASECLVLEREEDTDGDRTQGQAVHCPYCQHYFCVECLQAGHPDKSCIEAKKSERERIEREFEALVTEPLLRVSETATADEIREAYKREALRTHPDRATQPGPNGEEPLTRAEATALFQQVADAYYTLSDPQRRREYDQARRTQQARRAWTEGHSSEHAEPDRVFVNVFEALLRPEIENPSYFYAPLGMASGAVLGFICAGVPGLMAGGYTGKKLGQIRDNKGVSVMEAFSRLEQAQRMAILAALASKIFTTLK
ncbi:hypothetical protein BGZ73_001459 [Actinomortierella ambigua]|nr:hypothetical protein BGZ73_001459 [Actinomortierella ambigua]